MTALVLYLLIVSLLMAAAGLILERAAAIRQWPRRWAWAGVVVLTTLLAMTTMWGNGRRSTATTVSATMTQRGQAAGVVQGTAAFSWSDIRRTLETRVQHVAETFARFDGMARVAWIAATLVVALAYAFGRWTLARRRREWGEANVHGETVLVSTHDGPAVVGVLSPRIVIPRWALALDPHAIDLLLRHEQAHRRARDPLLMHVAAVGLLLMPWNPVMWWMASRLRLAVELDCDARVLAHAAGAKGAAAEVEAYGELLLAVATQRSPRPVIVPAMLEHSSTLRRRITAMYPISFRFSWTRAMAAGAVASGLGAIVFVLPVPTVQARAVPGERHAGVVAQNPSPTGGVPAAPAKDETSAQDDFGKGAYRYEEGSKQSQPHLVAPRSIHTVDPSYSREAMDAKITGEVTVEAVVGVGGNVGEARVTKSLDTVYGLDEAALTAVRKWLFAPGTLDGTPVPVICEVVFQFRLR